ncbi:MAG: hypothetical protein AAFZ65_18920 [Planctomycetota bacterium]
MPSRLKTWGDRPFVDVDAGDLPGGVAVLDQARHEAAVAAAHVEDALLA